MRAKLYIALSAWVTILAGSHFSYAALPAMTEAAQKAYTEKIQKLNLIGHNQGQGQGADKSNVSALTPQEKDNQNLKNRFSKIDPNDPNAARKEKLMNDSIIGLMGVESTSTLDKMNWNISGPDTGSLGRARGFSQVMDAHLTSNNPNEWAMKYLGQTVDPSYYNSSPELQVKLTTGVISDYANELVNKYPNYSDQQLRSMIYSKWFTGSYGNGSNYSVNDGYTSAPQYISRAENFLAKAYNKYGNNLPSISSYVKSS